MVKNICSSSEGLGLVYTYLNEPEQSDLVNINDVLSSPFLGTDLYICDLTLIPVFYILILLSSYYHD